MRMLLVLLMLPLLSFANDKDEPTSVAIFAGGCFWCMEPPFDKLEGVLSTTSGYIGGSADSAHYKKVSAGGTGHYEAVKIVYDPGKVDFKTLLDVFWVNVDPLDAKGQFCDKGQQYLSAIFPLNDKQRSLAEASLSRIKQKFTEPVATEILQAGKFYDAEDYHQDYYQRNPIRYKFYRTGCGRDRRLEQLWEDD